MPKPVPISGAHRGVSWELFERDPAVSSAGTAAIYFLRFKRAGQDWAEIPFNDAGVAVHELRDAARREAVQRIELMLG